MTTILVTNDDGITKTGIAKLADAMSQIGEVYVVAPDREMSAISHALSLNKPLRVKEIQPRWFAVSGTPTDCVYLAVKKLVSRRIDLVVSGINKGPNLGKDVHYSGTVAGAVEGYILGSSAISFSQIDGDDQALDRASEFAVELAKEVLNHDIGKRPLLNVNFPGESARGVRLSRLGDRHYKDNVSEETRGNDRYFYIAGVPVHHQQDEDTDCQVVDDGYISVTPMQLDLSDYEAQVKMTSWKIFR